MQPELKRELAALDQMTVDALREKHRLVFGEENRSRHRDYLRKRIAWRLQALAEGGLSERARRRALEIANDADLRIRMPSAPEPPPIAPERTEVHAFHDGRDGRLPVPGTTITRARSATVRVFPAATFLTMFLKSASRIRSAISDVTPSVASLMQAARVSMAR